MKHFDRAWLVCGTAMIMVILMSITLVFSKGAPVIKINAKLECSYESQDGVQFRYPGNGTKVKPRIENAINCWISVKKIPAGVTLRGKLKASGKMQEVEVIPRPDDTYSADASFSPDNGDFETCSAFGVTGQLVNQGKTVWNGKLKIDQSCPD
jgi:hypothetical protein